jgi:ribosomal protein L11
MVTNGGNTNMDKRNIQESFNGSTFGDQTAIQADNVSQNKEVGEQQVSEAFAELTKEVSQIKDKGQREQAHFFVEQLKDAYQKKDQSKAKKVTGFLKSIIGTAGSLAVIAKFFGITI